LKLKHLIFPDIANTLSDEIFVIIADTMNQSGDGEILGKPTSYEEAVFMLKKLQNKDMKVSSAYIVAKFKKKNNSWEKIAEESGVEVTTFWCDISDDEIKKYLDYQKNYETISGALCVSGYGSQFISRVEGSYTNAFGLPLVAVKNALKKLDYHF
jgi:septum formation protein